jgi:hypothetical protein
VISASYEQLRPVAAAGGRSCLSGYRQEHRPFGAFTDSQVDRPGSAWRQREGDDLAALAGDRERPVPAVQAHLLDVGAGGLGDPQPVQGQQRDQRMLDRWTEARSD